MSDESWSSTQVSLLLRVKDPRNDLAWGQFVDKYRAPIVYFCTRRYRVQEAVAEEIAQEVLLKLVTEMQRFQYRADQSFRGWLKTIAKNTILDHFRKENRRIDARTGDANLSELIENFAEPDRASELADVVSGQLHQELFQEAERLVQQRVDVQTWDAYRGRSEGRKAKDIAVDLNVNVTAVHKAKSRVLHMIREEIALMLRAH